MTPQELATEAINRLKLKITDLVFLEIQSDRELMRAYLRCVRDPGLDTTNQQIGKAVKTQFSLDNIDPRNHEPVSTLIQSYQPH